MITCFLFLCRIIFKIACLMMFNKWFYHLVDTIIIRSMFMISNYFISPPPLWKCQKPNYSITSLLPFLLENLSFMIQRKRLITHLYSLFHGINFFIFHKWVRSYGTCPSLSGILLSVLSVLFMLQWTTRWHLSKHVSSILLKLFSVTTLSIHCFLYLSCFHNLVNILSIKMHFQSFNFKK